MYTSPSPLPRRAPLRLPFSVHIRKLFFLFSQLRSLHHLPLIPHLSHRRSGHAPRRGRRLSLCLPCCGPVLAPRRGRRPRRPASFFFHAYGGDISRSGATSFWPQRPANFSFLCLRRPYFFQQRKKYGKERRQKPTVFGFPLSDSNHGTKRFRIESLVPPSPLPLPRTARRRAGLLSCSGTVASISAVSRIPAQLDRRTP